MGEHKGRQRETEWRSGEVRRDGEFGWCLVVHLAIVGLGRRCRFEVVSCTLYPSGAPCLLLLSLPGFLCADIPQIQFYPASARRLGFYIGSAPLRRGSSGGSMEGHPPPIMPTS